APPVRSTVGIFVFASQSIIRSMVCRVMISFRFGPAFTWQCTHVRLQSLPPLTWRISGRPRRSEIECSSSFCANLFITQENQQQFPPSQHVLLASVVTW